VPSRRCAGRGERSVNRAKPKPRRGRPARLSREAILDAGLALLEREPEVPLTLGRVAEDVGAVPAALYRHVGSLDALLDGVLGRVVEGIRFFEIRPRAAWPEQVREWMTCTRAQLLRYPAVLPLITRRGRTSPPWLEAVSVLVAILQRAGLEGRDLARAELWIAQTTVGIALEEAAMPLSEQVAAARSALPELGAEARARLAPLFPRMAEIDADAHFDFCVERTLAALALLVKDATPLGPGGRSEKSAAREASRSSTSPSPSRSKSGT
jgi:TetR/AcrR family transcriptional regulator, tetracycline repressor protein